MTCRALTYTALALSLLAFPAGAAAQPTAFFETHCYSCHDGRLQKGGLDLTALKFEPANPGNFARWVKVHDRIEAGEMPPGKKARPPADQTAQALRSLRGVLVEAEQ